MLPLLSSFVTYEDIMSGAVAIFVWIAIKINCCCGSNKLFPITLSKVVCSYSSVRTISSGQSQPLNIILRKALIWKHSTRFPHRNCVSNAFPHGLSRGHSFPHGNVVRGGWEENPDHRTSLPKYSSWTFKWCRDKLFCRLPSDYWSVSPQDNIMEMREGDPGWDEILITEPWRPKKTGFLLKIGVKFGPNQLKFGVLVVWYPTRSRMCLYFS